MIKAEKAEAKRRVQEINGTSYVYEDHPYWDASKRQARHKRTYIGKLDEAGNFIPSKAFCAGAASGNTDLGEALTARRYYGAGTLLDHIGEVTGVAADVKRCFPERWRQILSLVHFLVQEGESAVYRFPHWAHTHWHPGETMMASQDISDLFGSFEEADKLGFFRLQSERRLEREYLAYDTTSISSYSELIKQVRYGLNKDHDALPQINLALVFGESSGLPVYFRKLPGNISDVKTVAKLMVDLDFLKLKKIKLVLDRGFYSVDNINAMYRKHYKFIVGLRAGTTLFAQHVEAARESILSYANYLEEDDVYSVSTAAWWPYIEKDRAGKVTLEDRRRFYVHVYYNEQRAAAERAEFNKTLANLRRLLLDNSGSEEQNKQAMRYFEVRETPMRGRKVICNESAVTEHTRNFGFFVLISNEIKDGGVTLRYYRNKDLVEKTFCNLKTRLDMRRTRVFSPENLEGKLFVEFIALIYLAYIHKVMKDQQLYKNYSIQTLLDELDIIERFEYPGHRPHYGEVTTRQRKIYEAFSMSPPPTLL